MELLIIIIKPRNVAIIYKQTIKIKILRERAGFRGDLFKNIYLPPRQGILFLRTILIVTLVRRVARNMLDKYRQRIVPVGMVNKK